ncbi:MAG: 4Fe-4S dicluster domain-containing protein [Eggerthellaceae bacterium]|jgi:Fe-S-cluster-containing dehydrogenase component|nr:4Fe-4S dicluster domain-containing protein [Eggerthellaceae bacterium]MDR2716148.1 4Fe-4S dicluster domain-containing protein [Coriobacteriaceae bacterium]
MTRYVMVMDQRSCIGCQSCSVACRTWNDLPMDIIYNPVVSEGVKGEWPNVHVNYTPLICMHCEKEPCTRCCPTGASKKDKDGTVWVDHKKCMGCKACVQACPYGARDSSEMAPRFERYAQKCTFCRDRREMTPGAKPYCVDTCHQKARIFGDLDDPESDVAKIIGSVQTFRLMEDYGTEPQIYYIPALGGQR